MLVRHYLAKTLEHTQHLSAFKDVARARVDFDMDGPAGDLATRSDGSGGSDGSSDGCHAVTEAEVFTLLRS